MPGRYLAAARADRPLRAVDHFTGTPGDDVYYVDDPADTVDEQPGGGRDTIMASVSYSLAAGTEIEVLAAYDRLGTELINLTGNAIANSLFGNAAANRLDGGGGADLLVGYEDDDRYVIDDPQDLVVERTGEGQDAVILTVSYALPWDAEIEGMHAVDEFGSQPISFTGNAFDQTMWGNRAANIFAGGGGNDAFFGGFGDDIYYVDSVSDRAFESEGSAGGTDTIFTTVDYALGIAERDIEVLSAADHAATTSLTLVGNMFNNLIWGNAGNNIIVGGGGVDALIGGAGDDIYYVYSANDSVYEDVGEGYDTVFTSFSYSLDLRSDNFVEVLAVADRETVGSVNLTGNSLDNMLFGNDGANIITGGAGADIMVGYGGNDSYWLDSLSDWVEENAGDGADTVYVPFDFVLPDSWNVERVISSGTGITLIGNDLDNFLHGDSGDNIFAGGGGADTMFGFTGNDIYYIDDPLDNPVEGNSNHFGTDTAFVSVSFVLDDGSGVEVLSAISQSDTMALDLTGNNLDNRLFGNAGDNILDGKGGYDILIGYGGSDTFRFSTLLGGGSNNIDNIFNFDADDLIALDGNIFTGLGVGALAAGAFVVGTAAQDADDRIIYNDATGTLLFDADGAGGAEAIQFALLDTPLVTLSAADFVII